jgi:hypothetical protein
MKLNQLIAIVTGAKTQTQKTVTGIYKKIQSTELMVGISRKYTPKDEEGESLPAERKLVQFTADKAIGEAIEAWGRTWDLIADQDKANTTASVNVSIDGNVLLLDVNVLHLLFLEKQLVDVKTFVEKLPTLDPAEKWEWDDAQGCYATEPFETTKSKKLRRNHVKAEATKEHPAQVEVYTEDVIIGNWSTIKYCGALTVERKKKFLKRITKVQEAIKIAREEANMVEVSRNSEDDNILDYIFED